jgi:hypothetical protein
VRTTIQGFHQIRAHMPPLPTSNAVSLASCFMQPTDDNRPTDAVSHQLALYEHKFLLLFRPRQAPALLAPLSLCGIGKDKERACKAGPESLDLPEYRPD